MCRLKVVNGTRHQTFLNTASTNQDLDLINWKMNIKNGENNECEYFKMAEILTKGNYGN